MLSKGAKWLWDMSGLEHFDVTFCVYGLLYYKEVNTDLERQIRHSRALK